MIGRSPISISPRMVEDIKRIPELARRLENGEIAVRRVTRPAPELEHSER